MALRSEHALSGWLFFMKGRENTERVVTAFTCNQWSFTSPSGVLCENRSSEASATGFPRSGGYHYCRLAQKVRAVCSGIY